MPARAEYSGVCKKYAKIALSGWEEKHVDMDTGL